MEIQEIIELRSRAEAIVTQAYSQVEDLKNQLKNAEIELERSRGEYRAYDRQLTMLEARAKEPVPTGTPVSIPKVPKEK